MPLPYTHIVFTDGTNVFVQNTETGIIESTETVPPEPEVTPAQLLNQTFAENGSVLIKAGVYDITEPVDIPNRMALTFEPGAELQVPHGYNQYVLGIGSSMEHIQIRGGLIRELGDLEDPNPQQHPLRQWVGVQLLQDIGGPDVLGIRLNVIDGLKIFHADIAIMLRITHVQGWITSNLFQNITMWNANVFIDFNMPPEIRIDGNNGFNRNLFLNIIGQMRVAVPITASGVRNIQGRGNVFFNVTLFDFDHNPSAQTATIHGTAEDTLILGGTMTVQNFLDGGQRTQIIAPIAPIHPNHNQLFLNRLHVGSEDSPGVIDVRDSEDRDVFNMNGNNARLRVGVDGHGGRIVVRDGEGLNVFNMNGNNARLRVGVDGHGGQIVVRDLEGRTILGFNRPGLFGQLPLLVIGATGNAGHIGVVDGNGDTVFQMDGGNALLRVGTTDHAGDIEVQDGHGRRVFFMDGSAARLRVGVNEHAGSIEVENRLGRRVVHLDGSLNGTLDLSRLDGMLMSRLGSGRLTLGGGNDGGIANENGVPHAYFDINPGAENQYEIKFGHDLTDPRVLMRGDGDSVTLSVNNDSAGHPTIRVVNEEDTGRAAEFVGRTVFVGDVEVSGSLEKSGLFFKIDHPLNPEKQDLYHSAVESSEMMNMYNGHVELDEQGEARVQLPDWFEALNKDYRYQLTPIGGAAPNLHVASELSDNTFKIGGGLPGGRVSWQVTGVRCDAYAEACGFQVERDKPENERGHYRFPGVAKAKT